MEAVVVRLPLVSKNPLNGQHGHWSVKAKARKCIRNVVCLALRARLRQVALPVVVVVTRISPRKLDAWDGLPAALKPAIDGVADALGIRDDDPRVTWRVAQDKGRPKERAIEIRVEAA
jgi:hypothetical protein